MLIFERTIGGRIQESFDVIEKSGVDITAYECKWGKEDVVFTSFLKLYPDAVTNVVAPQSLL